MQILKESIEFPNLFSGSIEVSRVAFTVFGIDIYWYGILIAVGVVLAVSYAMKTAGKFGLISDNVFDTAFISIIAGFVGARAYYCIFYNLMNPESENKYNIITMFTKIHDGGLAIYGGVITGVVTAVIICRIKKSPLLPLLDVAAPAFLIGQAIGRWGNFINQECYGAPTAGDLPWGMTGSTIVLDPLVIEAQANNTSTVLVHPCFLYESLWCAAGLLLIHFVGRQIRKFNGEVFLYYVLWYGAGRGWIEGLRTDSLYAGSVKVSQVVAIVSAALALIMIVYFRVRAAKSGKMLYADTELSRERLDEYKKKQVLEKENAAAKKAMRKAEKALSTDKSSGISGDDENND